MKNAIRILKWSFVNLAAAATAAALSGCEMEQYFIRLPDNTGTSGSPGSQGAGSTSQVSQTGQSTQTTSTYGNQTVTVTTTQVSDSGPTGSDTGACFVESFDQPTAAAFKKIDILFVTDTSASLNEERAGIADGIAAFVKQLPADADYQMGVLLGHAESQWSGRLYRGAKNPTVLGNRMQGMPLDVIQKHLRSNLTQGPSEYVSDGGEMGLLSLHKAIQGDNLKLNRNYGFFREDAALAVVFISDEQDICWDYPKDVTPVFDGDRLEAPAKAKFCTLADGSKITPNRVLQDVKNFLGSRPVIFAAITYNESSFIPKIGENEIGYGYNELVKASAGGILVDMASGRFSEGLAEIGAHSQSKMNLITDYKLSKSPVAMDSIRVSVDGLAVSSSFQPITNEVHVADPGSALSHVTIEYCLEASIASSGESAGIGTGGINESCQQTGTSPAGI